VAWSDSESDHESDRGPGRVNRAGPGTGAGPSLRRPSDRGRRLGPAAAALLAGLARRRRPTVTASRSRRGDSEAHCHGRLALTSGPGLLARLWPGPGAAAATADTSVRVPGPGPGPGPTPSEASSVNLRLTTKSVLSFSRRAGPIESPLSLPVSDSDDD
jgi:hypothetical protein